VALRNNTARVSERLILQDAACLRARRCAINSCHKLPDRGVSDIDATMNGADLSLALGIGANTALFSLVDAVSLKTLPVRKPEKLALFSLFSVRLLNI
jgi:hypothetical protein